MTLRTTSIYSDEFWQEAKMSEMVERVGLAICNRQLGTQFAWADLTEEAKLAYAADGQAAIEAMKVPTPRMMHTGAMEYSMPIADPLGRHPIHSIYLKIIEEALK